jgi:hypothetical protein
VFQQVRLSCGAAAPRPRCYNPVLVSCTESTRCVASSDCDVFTGILQLSGLLVQSPDSTVVALELLRRLSACSGKTCGRLSNGNIQRIASFQSNATVATSPRAQTANVLLAATLANLLRSDVSDDPSTRLACELLIRVVVDGASNRDILAALCGLLTHMPSSGPWTDLQCPVLVNLSR